jgi:hypothetical protein
MSGSNLQPGYLLRAPQEEIDAWKDAAAEAGETLAQWLREAARRRLESREPPREPEPKPRKRKQSR